MRCSQDSARGLWTAAGSRPQAQERPKEGPDRVGAFESCVAVPGSDVRETVARLFRQADLESKIRLLDRSFARKHITPHETFRLEGGLVRGAGAQVPFLNGILVWSKESGREAEQ